MTAKPGPWEVVDAGDRIIVRNDATGDDLIVITYSADQDDDRILAERIAARLNASEGDER